MLNCKQVSHLLSQQRDRALTLKEKTELKLHLVMCPPCVKLSKQMENLGQLMKMFMKREERELSSDVPANQKAP